MLTLMPLLPRPENRTALTATSGLSYDELKERGFEATKVGELSKALSYYQESLEVARASDDRQLIDQAICNCSAVLITLSRQSETLSDLRQILMAGRCPENSFLAAINLSRAYVREKSPKKALFYAQVARDRAPTLGRDEWLVWSYNQLANCLVDESRFEEAVAEYRRALTLVDEERSAIKALLVLNLGYCFMMLDRMGEGLPLTFQALRWLRYLGARVYEVWPQLDLCYAYIELGRLDRARDHGLRALALAEENGDAVIIKNALYLLGETERADGHLDCAYQYFCQLQKQFYPESPQLADLMVVVEARQMVNLRA